MSNKDLPVVIVDGELRLILVLPCGGAAKDAPAVIVECGPFGARRASKAGSVAAVRDNRVMRLLQPRLRRDCSLVGGR
jgi:hypothetical protein